MIRTVAETGSTNADLLAEAKAGAPEGLWLRAERQVAGRGRVGRIWQSAAGNLYASTIVRVGRGEPPAHTLALVAAVALDEVADAYAGADRVQLKWPNDLMADGAKLAGILIEREGDAVVIGFGVNLAQHPLGLERPVTSIAALTGSAPDPQGFTIELAGAFRRWLARWRRDGLAPIRARWLERAHPLGSVLAVGGEEGLFDGLDASGALLLRRADGRIETVRAGDVFLV